MTARGELCSMATAHHGWTATEANAALDRHRAEVLNEAADWLVEAAVDAPTTGQRVGLLNAITGLRRLADAATPTSKEQ